MDEDIDRAVDDVRRARKYRHLCPDTIARVARWAAARSPSEKQIAKRTKRKLHQVYGAYLADWDLKALQRLLARIPEGADLEAVKPICRAIMGHHASTRERLGALDGLYEDIFRTTGVPRHVLDLGCGLHPFALPWMNLPEDVRYAAWEIDERIVALVNGFFRRVGRAELACWRDVFAAAPDEEADLVFLLKMLPCLERQEKGSGARMLRTINAPFVVVSFPARSLGGRDRGMEAHYGRTMEEVLAGSHWRVVRVTHGQEIFFILDKR